MNNIGIIGCGEVAHKRHLPAIKNMHLRLVAACDIDFNKTKTMGADRQYIDYQNLLLDKDVNIVVISTPNYLHPIMTIDALNANKRVILEKPIGVTVATVQTLLNHPLADQIAVCYQRRFDSLAKEIKNYSSSITSINCTMSVRRDPEYWNTWRSDLTKSGGGALKNIFIHYFDLLQWWTGGQYKIDFAKIANRRNIDQVIFVNLRMNNIPIIFYGSSIDSSRKNKVEVIFKDGHRIQYDKEDATHLDVYDQFVNHNNYIGVREALKSLQIVEDIYKYDRKYA